MRSTDLLARGFGSWQPFAMETERELLDRLPTTFGVYSMRFTQLEPRRLGESDIACIGRAVNQNRLRGRVRQYFHPGWLQSTNLEMKARLLQRMVLQLAWVVTPDRAKAIDLESELLLAFEGEHGERPPYNKQAALAHLSSERA